ncbi:beta/gamma crystallin domain-containing protein [Saccharopolyspora gloriosae]|uniref:beta/gamma crystallin domain-containing protein n=1 Tax=Saccharopolyspora gloriosae TaxID=455344 RepID=UPI001FB76A79|nr:beta/gamma crystallin domain-containing protein [Saccharopolyspora gloriosae]
MLSKTKKGASTAVAALAAAAAFSMVGPAGTAFAIDKVECTPGENFLKIWSHSPTLPPQDSVDCYANGGKTEFGGWWVDRISTGNNAVILYDNNGDQTRYEPGTVKDIDPEAKINAIEIV